MPRFDDKHVMITGCTVVWDGVTRPDTDPQTGKVKYTLKVVVPTQSPDLAEFNTLALETLQASKFRGQLPAGGLMPIGQTKPGEFNNLFPGHAVISGKTFYAPDVYDEAGTKLDPMQYAPSLYPGQRVDVLLHCYDYDKAGNRGVAAGLDGLRIVASAAAPKLDIGTGGVDTAAAFGAPAAVPGQPVPGAPVPGAPVPGAPAGGQITGYDPATGAPIYGPAAPAPGTYPGQATNFLPPGTPVPGAPVPGAPVPGAPVPGTITGYDPQTGAPIYQQ